MPMYDIGRVTRSVHFYYSIVVVEKVAFIANFFFFFNDTATTEIYTLSLHDALPISSRLAFNVGTHSIGLAAGWAVWRSEEHTSELQSPDQLVCRLLLEKKNNHQSRTLVLIRNNNDKTRTHTAPNK